MRDFFKYSLLVFALLFAGTIADAESNSGEKTHWIRPIIDKCSYTHTNNKVYKFFKDELVEVAESGSGDIIIGSDTLKTDSLKLTDWKRKKEISDSIYTTFPKLKDRLNVINDSLLAFNFGGIKGEGKIRVVTEPYGDSIVLAYDKNDTVALSSFKFDQDSILHLVPDSAVMFIVKISEIPSIKIKDHSETDSETGLSWWGVLIFVILGIVFVAGIGYVGYKWFVNRKNTTPKSQEKKDIEKKLKKFKKYINKQITHISEERKKTDLTSLNEKKDSLNKSIDKLIKCINEDSSEYYQQCWGEIEELIDSFSFKNKIEEKKNNQHINHKNYQGIIKLLETTKSNVDKICSSFEENAKVENDADETKPVSSGSPFDLGENVINSSHQSQEQTKEELQEKISKLDKELKSAREEKEKLQKEKLQKENELNELKENQREKIAEKVIQKEKELDREKEKIKKKAEEDIKNANQRAQKAEEQSRRIKDEMNTQFNKERERLNEEKSKLNKNLKDTKEELNSTKESLAKETTAHNEAKREVARLTEETTSFKNNLSGATDSKDYCTRVRKIFGLANKVQQSAEDLLKLNLSDEYFIYKALAKYSSKIKDIELLDFYTEVEMVSKIGFVIKGTPLSTYEKALSPKEVERLTKEYFFGNYLKSYIDALMVLNESLIGLQYLVEDVEPSVVKVFEGYRNDIIELSLELGINVLSVKIYDGVGSNTDLKAVEIDAGYSKHGAILEIENCLVSLVGSAKGEERIKVKIQK